MGVIRKTYPEQFKEEAVKLAGEAGISKAAKDLGIDPGNIRRWQKKENGPSSNKGKSKEFAQLERELLKTKKELRYVYEVNSVLKKSLGIFAIDKKFFQ